MKGKLGSLFSKNCNNWSPPLPSFFELHEQNESQKDTFLMHNSDSLKVFIVLPWKNWKIGIFQIDVFYTGALCTKTLNANSDI